MQERTCVHCGVDITHRRRDAKACSKRCLHLHAKATETRPCSAAGCSGKFWAKGYCATHYNKLIVGESRRHPKVVTGCVICGTQVMRRKDKAGIHLHTCSVSCRALVQWGKRVASVSNYEWRDDAISRAKSYGARIIDRFDREEIFERDGWACQICGIRCSSPDPYSITAATADHVVALSAGGDHSRANAQTACLSCNSRKSGRLEAVA